MIVGVGEPTERQTYDDKERTRQHRGTGGRQARLEETGRHRDRKMKIG